jgi:hypothetical protein
MSFLQVFKTIQQSTQAVYKVERMSLNVNRGVSDAFYRYKMPKLLAKVEGKGNGIKTVIVNMVDIAKALGRPPTCKSEIVWIKVTTVGYLNPTLQTTIT